ncbi:uncharacterized protein LOC130118348 isoform X2 [Lampris incognitus]|uniref:uncharacterized protein LOC130118348 isoform X2 n=1 Tax=Lampris incognitus TaxID=2546036 RepID=UPI0024B5CBBD|nr:uncharacterized protein LOC130118348 isoform X2 [Lampris incognitus]
MALGAQISNTTFPDGASPELKRLDLHTFQCPFCHRAGEYPGLMAHLQGHQRSIVKYGGYNVYKCHLGCVASSHYHCGFCPRIIVRKELFFNHFKNCCTQRPTTAQATTATVATPLTVPATTATLATAPTTAPATTATVATPLTVPATTVTLATAPTMAPATKVMADSVTAPTALTTSATSALVVTTALATTTTAPAKGRHISTAPKILKSKLKKTTCCFCNLQLQKKNLKMHMQRHHSSKTSDITANHHLQSVCIDKKRGIFAVSRTFKGPVHCIHVQKCTWGINHQVSCQLETCNRAYDYARRCGLVGFDCDHVRSLVYSPVATNSAIVLDEGILIEMVVNKWFSKDTESECLRRKLAADTDGAPLSVEVNLGQGQGHIYFSVLEPLISPYSRLGRVMVHYEDTRNTWHCPCSKPRKSCPHKSIAKWHLHQSRPDLFTKIETCCEDSPETFVAEGAPVVDDTQAENIPLYPPEGKVLVEMVEYLISHKALPTSLPKNLASLQSSEDMPRHLVPQENYCHKCPGKVLLSEPIAISKKAKIVTVAGIVEGVTTYCKKCAACGIFYRYQEWAEGLHNFNDHVILTHHFCLFLRNSIQNHTAVGRVVEALQATNNQKYPDHDSILYGYRHFEALSSHKYDLSCVHRGDHPAVGIMDLHKKGVFSMAMSDFQEPPLQFDGQVDTEDLLRPVSREVLCRGFLKSNAANPCVVSPSYHKRAPWIGPHSRANSTVFSTDYMKGQGRKRSNSTEQAEMDTTDERLTNEIMNLKVDAVRNLVKHCGLDTTGSKMDLVIRLREQMKSRSTYDKVFQKVWGASDEYSSGTQSELMGGSIEKLLKTSAVPTRFGSDIGHGEGEPQEKRGRIETEEQTASISTATADVPSCGTETQPVAASAHSRGGLVPQHRKTTSTASVPSCWTETASTAVSPPRQSGLFPEVAIVSPSLWKAVAGMRTSTPVKQTEQGARRHLTLGSGTAKQPSVDLDTSFNSMKCLDSHDESFHPESDSTTMSSSYDEAEQEPKAVVYQSCVLELFKMCQKCGSPVNNTSVTCFGAQMMVAWDCLKGHSGTWKSSPDV